MAATDDKVVASTGRSRNACVFDIFFRPDSTPRDLLANGIYQSIAMTLKGGEWRLVSLKMFAKELRNKAAPAVDEPVKPSRSRVRMPTVDVVAECVASRKLQYSLVASARKRRHKREEAAAVIIQKLSLIHI